MYQQFSTIYTMAHEREDAIRKEASQQPTAAALAIGHRRQLATLLRELADRIAPAPTYGRDYADKQSH